MLRLIGLILIGFATSGCGSGIPDKPLPMDLEAETTLARKNAEIEINMIRADKSLSDADKTRQIAAVHAGVEGYLKTFAESKKARDEQYGVD